MRREFLTGLSVAILSTGLAACGGGKDDLEKQVNALQDELARVQGDFDMMSDRVSGLEAQLVAGRPVAAEEVADDEASEEEEAEEEAPGTLERKRLKVIRLEPKPTAPAAADPEAEEEPRPLLQGSGDHAEIKRPTSFLLPDAKQGRLGQDRV